MLIAFLINHFYFYSCNFGILMYLFGRNIELEELELKGIRSG